MVLNVGRMTGGRAVASKKFAMGELKNLLPSRKFFEIAVENSSGPQILDDHGNCTYQRLHKQTPKKKLNTVFFHLLTLKVTILKLNV